MFNDVYDIKIVLIIILLHSTTAKRRSQRTGISENKFLHDIAARSTGR